MKLNLGCGTDIRPGWLNVDRVDLPGVDLIGDISDPKTFADIPDDTVTSITMFHILEHIQDPLPLLQELYRIAEPGCFLEIRVPHGACDMAFADPQHVRQYFASSFQFFASPAYKRADYGYRGDWDCTHIQYRVDPSLFDSVPPEELQYMCSAARNVIWELRARLTAIKPARPVSADFPYNPSVTLVPST